MHNSKSAFIDRSLFPVTQKFPYTVLSNPYCIDSTRITVLCIFHFCPWVTLYLFIKEEEEGITGGGMIEAAQTFRIEAEVLSMKPEGHKIH